MDPLELIHDMLAIPSPSRSEGELARFLAERMGRMGFEATVDEVGNVVGEIGSRPRPRILLLGHLDTVAGQIPVRRDGSLLYGRGAVDAKGPLAVMIAAAAAARLDGKIVVAGAVEEEVPASTGAHHLLRTQPRPDAVVIGEPTGWTGIGIGYKGRVGIEYEVERPPTHSSTPEEKASEVAVEFWAQLRDHLAGLHDPPREGEGLFERATATLTRFEADMERARAAITCRVPLGFDFDAFEAYLAGALRGGLVRVDERTPAVRSDRRDPVVRALAGAIRARDGQPALKVKTGTSDMNLVHARWRPPLAAYGPGDSTLDHTDREHLDVEEFVRGIDVLTRALPAIAEAVAPPEDGLTDDEEAVVTARLRSLGYLE
jgi:LysW-gamma-L-lysine carboxypeptidase